MVQIRAFILGKVSIDRPQITLSGRFSLSKNENVICKHIWPENGANYIFIRAHFVTWRWKTAKKSFVIGDDINKNKF